MSADRPVTPSSEDPRCAVRVVLDRIADKWTALVIALLADGDLGYMRLRRAATGISDKMLAQTLQGLERDGLVTRTVHTSRPIRVTYALTPLGHTLVPALAALVDWTLQYGPELVANQTAYDARLSG
ncbi:winged helix-turn-helix transcriptional regulator [Kribbella sp. NPDC050124]|uniref:winged helix-turn-helix transcriptional regulator n=1 Tax=Kribbella sp. NPDC050124 TaxID=3364114 RepID=UPI0037BCBEC7